MTEGQHGVFVVKGRDHYERGTETSQPLDDKEVGRASASGYLPLQRQRIKGRRCARSEPVRGLQVSNWPINLPSGDVVTSSGRYPLNLLIYGKLTCYPVGANMGYPS
jgi:hypothetical protein